MNALSWMIYAAEIAGRLSNILSVAAVITVGFLGIVVLIYAMMCADGDRPEGDWQKPLRYLWVPAALGISAAVIPSSQTIYLIAASEAGETVVTSPDTIEMFGDLKAIIKKRLKEELAD